MKNYRARREMSSNSINPIFEIRASLSFDPMEDKIKLPLKDIPA